MRRDHGFVSVVTAGALALGVASACDREPGRRIPLAAPSASIGETTRQLFLAEPLEAAMHQLVAKTGEPVEVLKLIVSPDHLVMQARSRHRPGDVNQFVYGNGTVRGPVPVKLKGKGKLAENLFPLGEANWRAIPDLVARAPEAAKVEEGRVTKIVVKRNLPATTDIRFRISITGPRRDATVDASGSGRFLPAESH